MSSLMKKNHKEKSSYYVWFLGVKEYNELYKIPNKEILARLTNQLVDKSHYQEPLKVTLQISMKGLKIIQGSIKHHVPPNAITCSIVLNDVVSCSLVLFNSSRSSHVHAYRCDSKLTAHALHDHLQNLMKTCSGTQLNSNELDSRRFRSSVGSDTGTSTSEDRQGIMLPVTTTTEKPKASNLFESLNAELRFKLSRREKEGPLLLPPKDYDTICRSRGNLMNVDLRRSQNTNFVGKSDNCKQNHHNALPKSSSSYSRSFVNEGVNEKSRKTLKSDSYHIDNEYKHIRRFENDDKEIDYIIGKVNDSNIRNNNNNDNSNRNNMSARQFSNYKRMNKNLTSMPVISFSGVSKDDELHQRSNRIYKKQNSYHDDDDDNDNDDDEEVDYPYHNSRSSAAHPCCPLNRSFKKRSNQPQSDHVEYQTEKAIVAHNENIKFNEQGLRHLKKGYRHSVALPDKNFYKNCNRVGLAALEIDYQHL